MKKVLLTMVVTEKFGTLVIAISTVDLVDLLEVDDVPVFLSGIFHSRNHHGHVLFFCLILYRDFVVL